MIISISGSVGSGKTSLANLLHKKLPDFKLIHLNDLAEEFKISDVKELQTFDFDLDELLDKLEKNLKNGIGFFGAKNIILEGHFAHFISPNLIDMLFIINRDLEDLKKEYISRDYNEEKQKDNLEVESFNLCFYEAEENNYNEKKLFCLDNDLDIEDLRDNVMRRIKKFEKLKENFDN